MRTVEACREVRRVEVGDIDLVEGGGLAEAVGALVGEAEVGGIGTHHPR